VVRALVLAALLVSLAGPAAAAVGLAATVEELAGESDAVLRGRVAGRASRWSEGGRRLVTEIVLEVNERWRGEAPARVVLLVPGGERDGVGQRVDGAPAFDDGEEVVVFLRRLPGGAFRVHGMAQGKFRVVEGEARPDLRRVRLVAGEGRAGSRRVEAMPLDELARRVRAP
jgi:hypothetical protein